MRKRKINILLVDDEDAEDIMSNMELKGYSVIPYRNGRDVMSAISGGIKYDVAVIDASLPDTDGTQIMELSKFLYPKVPVISISGYNKKPKPSDTHFLKPFNEDRLDEWIKAELKIQ